MDVRQADPPARQLPRGTVTFMFTDIEGSTHLADVLGERWPAMLERHREIVRAALSAAGGIEVQTEGDGFFVVFTNPPAAVAAAVRAQRDVQAEPWPEEAPVRLRIGLHTGEGIVDRDGSYVGLDVHRAARIGAAANGGQVLVSDTTRALVVGSLPDDVSLRDLGEHRLRDLRPEPLAQLVVGGLPEHFPRLRSVDARPNNLPVQLTSFIGRERELAAASELLAGTRLLTLTGAGGTGKTRLALQLAASASDRYPDGVWFVALEPLRDPALVLPTVAHTLGIAPRPSRSALDAVAEAMREQRVLIVLDNFEQVIEAAGDVASLIRACPLLSIVVTSRAVLHVSGEQEYAVPGLPAPPDLARLSRLELEELPASVRHPDARTLDQYEAVRLFIARARSLLPGFSVNDANAPAIAGITARLHGMPLAIELAAARVKLLDPEQILARLETQLGILASSARDLPDRQRTLRGAIAWSHDLLDSEHRRLLACLSVFRGGWDLAAAEAVVTADLDILDGIADLVDQSLVRRSDDESGGIRFAMLESIREFAAGMLLDAGAAEAAAEAHARHFLALAEEAAPNVQGAEPRPWLERLERDHDNLRAALGWALERPEPSIAVRLSAALWRFWQQRGYLDEARRLFDRLEAARWQLTPDERATLAEAAGGTAYWQADLPAAMAWYDEALEIRRRLAETADAGSQGALANALYNRAYTSVAQIMLVSDAEAQPDEATQAMLEEALSIYRALGDTAGEADLLWALGGMLLFSSEPALAEANFRSSVELHRKARRTAMEGWSLHMLSATLLMLERHDEAAEVSQQALRHFSTAGDISGITLALDVQGVIAVADGDHPRGGRLWGAARRLQASSGTGLADWDARLFAMLSLSVDSRLTKEELERYAPEGAALPLAEVVAYGLGEADPFGRS